MLRGHGLEGSKSNLDCLSGVGFSMGKSFGRHLIGLLGFFWRVFIHARRVADCVTRQVAVYRVSVTRQFVWISGILEMGYLQGFVLSFWGSWRWDISRDSTKTCMHLRSAIRGQGPMTPTVTLWVWQVDYRGSEARYKRQPVSTGDQA